MAPSRRCACTPRIPARCTPLRASPGPSTCLTMAAGHSARWNVKGWWESVWGASKFCRATAHPISCNCCWPQGPMACSGDPWGFPPQFGRRKPAPAKGGSSFRGAEPCLVLPIVGASWGSRCRCRFPLLPESARQPQCGRLPPFAADERPGWSGPPGEYRRLPGG